MKGNISKAKRNVPTMISQLTDDVGYLKKTEASATYIPQIITDIQTCEVSTPSGRFYLTTARGGKLYIGGDPETVFLNGLMTPTEDTSAATKKYVDDKVSGISVPTKVSQLENDEKYIKNTGTDIDEERRVVKIGDSGLYNLVLEAYQVRINSESSGYVAITNLQDPASDRDAATKKYVDGKVSGISVPTKVSQLENDSKFIQNLSENPERQISISPISFILGTITTTISAKGFSVTDSLNNEYISVLENESGEGIGSLTLKYLATPKAKTDAANKQYVDSAIASAITTALNTAV